jgi:hypothetical protein
MRHRLVTSALFFLAFGAIWIWGITPQQQLNAFGTVMAAACFALVGWHFFSRARNICAHKAAVVKRCPSFVRYIFPPASLRSRANVLMYQVAGLLLLFISIFLICLAVRRLLVP